ncbi:MAG: recA bacterial recombination protein [Actinobacteria bacterium]|nr:recA bacterial recombination protein [Actinomycetota bacterium]
MAEAVRVEAAAPAALPRPVPVAEPGRVLGLVGPPGLGLTRLGLSLLADPARRGPVAVVDVRGWLCPPAAWEAGVPPERLVVVRCAEQGLWGRVTAALLEGLPAVYAEVPPGAAEVLLRRLGALARARRAALILRPLRGGLPSGLALRRGGVLGGGGPRARADHPAPADPARRRAGGGGHRAGPRGGG